MDAMQKRRMWKVIGYHLFFSVYVLFLLLTAYHPIFLNPSNPKSWIVFLGGSLLTLLQPVALTVANHGYEIAGIILIPLWSICFGWVFVKILNWLNHFPVLGKKVF
jgi:hypothetical protein